MSKLLSVRELIDDADDSPFLQLMNSENYVLHQLLPAWRRTPSTPATTSKQRSTLSKQHSTLLPQTATKSNVASTKSNVASTMLLVWTGPKTAKLLLDLQLDVSITTLITSSVWRHDGCTWQAHVVDVQEFVITTWIVKECRVDGQWTSCVAATHRVQRMLHVYFTLTVIRNVATQSARRVIPPVPRLLEHEQVISSCTWQFEHGVEAGVVTS